MRLIVSLLVLSFVPASLSAQTTATLTGRVVDASGGVLPGTTITARHIARGIERTSISDNDGRFVIAGLPSGIYTVRAELIGFAAVMREGLMLTVGEANTIEFTLQLTTLVDPVIVVASPINSSMRRIISMSRASRRSRAISLVRRSAVRCAAIACSISSDTKRCGRILAARSRQRFPISTRDRGGFPIPPTPVSSSTLAFNPLLHRM